MALQSSLFQGDPKLEAAAVSDAAHIVPGMKGEHVRKIQLALNQLDKAGLDADSIYGNATAAAVLAYKRKRNIINKAYQSQADNIVGKMTIAALDRELLQQRPLGPLEFKVRGGQPVNRLLPLSPFVVRQSLVSPRESFAVTGPRVAAPNPQTITTASRWPPNSAGMITCLNTGSTGTAICTNHGDVIEPPGAPAPWLLNVNIPNRPDVDRAPLVVTRLGRRHASEPVIVQQSPRGDPIYWIGPAGDAREAGAGTDFHATAEGKVSLTPLQVDLTDHATLGAWRASLAP